MKDAPDRLQWAMNECLANIGIHHPSFVPARSASANASKS